jgi:cytochrome c553
MVVFGVGGFLLAASGFIPIKASSGHWAITRWFLNFAKERSVATHTWNLKPPALEAHRLVVKGAGHYETGCRSCHGSPGMTQPRIAQRMTPAPPDLASVVLEREASELFYVIKHGIKFTGMPAWPSAQRDDEVWAMVAFLRQLPGLDAENYRRLATGETVPAQGAPMEDLLPPGNVPQAVIQSCARCHGLDGLGRGLGAFPKLAGQKPGYLLASLQAYARGNRYSGMMEPVAAGLTPGTMRELALYYANLPGAGPQSSIMASGATETAAAIERGEAIARGGIPSRQVPACAACHGPSPTRRHPNYPVLAGQYPDYLALQLELFQDEHRGGTDYSHLMHFVVGGLTTEQIREVTLYYSSLALERDPP